MFETNVLQFVQTIASEYANHTSNAYSQVKISNELYVRPWLRASKRSPGINVL